MAETEKFAFDFKEIATELVKKQGIHEGIWALYFDFGLTGANISVTLAGGKPTNLPDEPPTDVVPSAIMMVQRIGIVRAPHVSNVSVDAAKVNPRPRAQKKK